MGDINTQQFLAALESLHSPHTSAEARKQAESFLLQTSDEAWAVAKELLSGNHSAEVHLFAAQTLRRKALACRSEGMANREVLQRLQQELLQLIHSLPNHPMKVMRQLSLALAAVSLCLCDSFPHLLQQTAQNLPASTVLLLLETLAEEATSLTPFGPGSMEERAHLVSSIKAQLRSNAKETCAWLAHIASKQPHPKGGVEALSTASAPRSDQDKASGILAAAIMSCFQAWIKLGSLQELDMGDAQSLVNLALSHMQDVGSPAFITSGDVLNEVLDHCPDPWLDALHEPMLRLTDLAVAAAKAGQTSAAEAICKVVSCYATLRIYMEAPGSYPESAAIRDALMALALLPQVNEAESGDPVCWPALQAWTSLAETMADVELSMYDVFNSDDFYNDGPETMHDEEDAGHAQAGQQGQQPNGHSQGASGQQGGGFTSAGQMLQAQDDAAYQAPAEVKSIYEQLYVGLLSNLVSWQQKSPSSASEVIIDGFTPTFMAAIGDCLAAVCTIVGPARFTSLLYMLMQQPPNGSSPKQVAAAAMLAVSSAGGYRLTSKKEPASMQALAVIMQHAVSLDVPEASGLVPLCCALAASGRQCLSHIAKAGGGVESAKSFLTSAFPKLMAGLTHPDDSLDVHTPSALAAKSLLLGARDAGVPVPLACVQALVTALPKQSSHDTAAEQAMVVALKAAITGLEGSDDAMRKNMEFEAYKSLASPVHGALMSAHQQLSGGSSWGSIKENIEEQLTGPLRRFALIFQHALQEAGGVGVQTEASLRWQQTTAPGSSAPEPDNGFSWLVRTFLTDLWPALGGLLVNYQATGDWLQPATRCLTTLLRVQPPGARDHIPAICEALVGALFRPGGKHVAEPISAALETLSPVVSMLPLLQQVMMAVLGAPRTAALCELGQADQDPDTAEALLKVLTAYIRHMLATVAQHSGEAAGSALGTIMKVAAACACCNHRGVNAAAMQCTGAALAAARSAASADLMPGIVSSVLQEGQLVATGALGALLSVSPLSRVAKVCGILVDLSALAATPMARKYIQSDASDQQAQAQGAPQDAGAPPPPVHSQVVRWLGMACQQFAHQISAAEQSQIMGNWPGALAEALSGEGQAAHEQEVKGRRLKKIVREFADKHSRNQ